MRRFVAAVLVVIALAAPLRASAAIVSVLAEAPVLQSDDQIWGYGRATVDREANYGVTMELLRRRCVDGRCRFESVATKAFPSQGFSPGAATTVYTVSIPCRIGTFRTRMTLSLPTSGAVLKRVTSTEWTQVSRCPNLEPSPVSEIEVTAPYGTPARLDAQATAYPTTADGVFDITMVFQRRYREDGRYVWRATGQGTWNDFPLSSAARFSHHVYNPGAGVHRTQFILKHPTTGKVVTSATSPGVTIR